MMPRHYRPWFPFIQRDESDDEEYCRNVMAEIQERNESAERARKRTRYDVAFRDYRIRLEAIKRRTRNGSP